MLNYINNFKYICYYNILFTLLLYIFLYYKCFNTITKHQIYLSHYFIQKSGAITIKIAQHINMFANTLGSNDGKMKYFTQLFDTLYENVDIHSFNYSSSLFKQEYHDNILDVFEIDTNYKIKSGSVAQVYKAKIKKNIFDTHYKTVAIKVVHPDFDIQLKIIHPIIAIYDYLYINNYFKGTIFNIIDLYSLFYDLSNQNNMQNEYNNIKYYYQQYENNKVLHIPYPISCTKNILVMEYVDAIDINTIYKNDPSTEYKLIHILWTILLFARENYSHLDLLHADLHDYNWKIKSNDYSKVVIFDYGLIINKRLKYKSDEELNTLNTRISNIMLGLDNKDLDLFIENILKFVTFDKYNTQEDIEKIKTDFRKDFFKSLQSKDTTSNLIQTLMLFSMNRSFKFDKIILNIMIIIIALTKHLETFIYPKSCKKDMLLTHYISQIEFCRKNKIFDHAKNDLEKNYINNETFLKNNVINNRLNHLLTSNNDINNDVNYDI